MTLSAITDPGRLFLHDVPLLDVRAPVEFARGSFPSATNLPLMDDRQRHLVGVRYKQAGQEAAMALGAELVDPALRAERTAGWRQFTDRHPDGALFCFRGGLRSRIVQQWLMDTGVHYPRVEGGYKTLRRFLIDRLADILDSLPLCVIGGRTGVGKTVLIRTLGRAVDLEGLARHRGSSFGRLTDPQPGNIDFENSVSVALLKLHAEGNAVVHLEDEARLIGRVCLPDVLREAMQRAPAVLLEASMQTRIDHAMQDYVIDLLARYGRVPDADPDITFGSFAAHHRDSLARVQKRLGADAYREASAMLETALVAHRRDGDLEAYRVFIAFMLHRYYDPMYDYQLSRKQRRIVFTGDAEAIREWIRQRR